MTVEVKLFSGKILLPKFVQCTKTRSDTVEIKRDSYLEQLKIRKEIVIVYGI